MKVKCTVPVNEKWIRVSKDLLFIKSDGTLSIIRPGDYKIPLPDYDRLEIMIDPDSKI